MALEDLAVDAVLLGTLDLPKTAIVEAPYAGMPQVGAVLLLDSVRGRCIGVHLAIVIILIVGGVLAAPQVVEGVVCVLVVVRLLEGARWDGRGRSLTGSGSHTLSPSAITILQLLISGGRDLMVVILLVDVVL